MDNNEVKGSIYSSNYTMSKEMVKDFCSTDFHKLRNLYILFICIFTFYLVATFFMKPFEDVLVIMTGFILALLMVCNYIKFKKGYKVSYERALVSNGKEVTVNYDFFDDKIVSYAENLERELSYNDVTKFFETKHFLMLHIKHNLFVTVEKNSLDANVDEVKKFFIDKCVNVKKKKFVNCVNDEKWSIILLIVFVIVAVGGVVAHWFI